MTQPKDSSKISASYADSVSWISAFKASSRDGDTGGAGAAGSQTQSLEIVELNATFRLVRHVLCTPLAISFRSKF